MGRGQHGQSDRSSTAGQSKFWDSRQRDGQSAAAVELTQETARLQGVVVNPAFDGPGRFVPNGTAAHLGSLGVSAPGDSTTLNIAAATQSVADERYLDFFGGYLIRSLNWFHRKALKARLWSSSENLPEKYYKYCYKQKVLPYHYTFGLSEAQLVLLDFSAMGHGRHFSGSFLPVNLPEYTEDRLLNKANQKINQSNWLLEQRLRAYIRKRLAELQTKKQDPEDGDLYDQLLTEVLFEIQDPDVRWVELSDAGIAAGLILQEEIILSKQYGTKVAYETRDDVDEDSEQKAAPPKILPVFRGSQVVVPEDESYPEYAYNDYLQPVVQSRGPDLSSVKQAWQGEQESTQAHYDLATNSPNGAEEEHGEEAPYYSRGNVADDGQSEEGAPEYDLAHNPKQDEDAAARVKSGSAAGGYLWVGAGADAPPDSEISAAAATGSAPESGGFGFEEDEEGGYDPKTLAGVKFLAVAPRSSVKPKPEQLTKSAREEDGDSNDFYEVVIEGDSTLPTGDKDEDSGHSTGSGSQEDHQQKATQEATPPRLPRRPLRLSGMGTGVGSVFEEPEAPIPPNPFIKSGETESSLVPDTLYAQLVRDIRKALKQAPDTLSLTGIVRNEMTRLTGEGHAAPEQTAIKIVALLASREIPCPGFNYLAGIAVSKGHYGILFTGLADTVRGYREYFAAKEGTVPAKPNAYTLNDNMDNITPFLKAFIPLYLQELAWGAEKQLPFQFSIVSRASVSANNVSKNIFVVIKRAKPEGGCEQHNYYLLSDSQTGNVQFKRTSRALTSYHELDLHKDNAQASESFADDPWYYGYRDEHKQKYNVIAASNVSAMRVDKDDKPFKGILPDALLAKISGSAIQQAYNQQEQYSLGKRVGRWLETHPKTKAAVAAGVVVGGAAVGVAYAMGVFKAPPPCGGYSGPDGACVEAATLPDAQCSLQVGTFDTQEGGTIRMTPACGNLAAFTASEQSFTITNLPAGARVTVNGETTVHSGGDFDATPHVNQEMTVELPDGFNGAWTPQGATYFKSGALEANGTVRASQAVVIEPVAGTATLSLTQGSFTGLVENGNATFTMQWNPAPGDLSVNKYVRNLPLGDRLCAQGPNGSVVCFESTAENGGAGVLNFAGRTTVITYIPRHGASGSRGFVLYDRSVDGVAEGPASADFNVNYNILGVADVPVSVEAPDVIYTVEGQVSPAFNLTATPAEGDDLQKAVVLQPGGRLCGTLSSNDAPVCVGNTGATVREFDISNWNEEVTYEGPGDFVFKARGTANGGNSVSPWLEYEVDVDQLDLPMVTITQDANNTPLTRLSGVEDEPVQFNLGVVLDPSVERADVVLQFPTVTAPFASGTYQVNGTLANGVNVVANVTPGSSLNVSAWNLGLPVEITPPANVNRGNQAGDLDVGVRVTAYAADGREASTQGQVGLNVREVVDPFGFSSILGTSFPIRVGTGRGIGGIITPSVFGEQVSQIVLGTLPFGVDCYESPSSGVRIPVAPRADGTRSLVYPSFFANRYVLSVNTSAALGDYNLRYSACVNDFGDEECDDKNTVLSIFPPL